jgi:hypothetical protein
MLLEAACLARLGNALRLDSVVADPFIVSAIYIDDQLFANWYLVYQPNVSDTAVGLFLQEAVRHLRLGANEDNRTLRDPFRIVGEL